MKLRWRFSLTVVLLIATVILGTSAVRQQRQRQKLSFPDSLDMVAAVVDEEPLTLSDLAVYIAYQEQQIEEKALIYNPEDTGEYWNIYTNHTFFREEGKRMAMNMAVHDEILYRLALAEEISLTAEEEKYLSNSQYDFWSDLSDVQRERLGISEDVLKESMRKMAVAEKYQYLLAEMYGSDFEEYSASGTEYLKLLETHEYELDETIWERVPFGSITVDH